jgi:hypothetical protein
MLLEGPRSKSGIFGKQEHLLVFYVRNFRYSSDERCVAQLHESSEECKKIRGDFWKALEHLRIQNMTPCV